MNYIENKIEKELKQLNESGDFRYLPNIKHDGKFISAYINGKERTMLNLSSNDYLGIASDKNIQEDFIEKNNINEYSLTSSSSRLLTGNFSIYTETEGLIARKFGKESALLFSSGYQMNTGILPAITDKNTLILADKLVHASIIDGMIDSAGNGRIIKEGIQTVILGKPNAGKSSLLNVLSGRERAIVTEIEGTKLDISLPLMTSLSSLAG